MWLTHFRYSSSDVIHIIPLNSFFHSDLPDVLPHLLKTHAILASARRLYIVLASSAKVWVFSLRAIVCHTTVYVRPCISGRSRFPLLKLYAAPKQCFAWRVILYKNLVCLRQILRFSPLKTLPHCNAGDWTLMRLTNEFFLHCIFTDYKFLCASNLLIREFAEISACEIWCLGENLISRKSKPDFLFMH